MNCNAQIQLSPSSKYKDGGISLNLYILIKRAIKRMSTKMMASLKLGAESRKLEKGSWKPMMKRMMPKSQRMRPRLVVRYRAKSEEAAMTRSKAIAIAG
jgi:siroheme synthase (precorrin-2 oxidase/ferrochelatase)